MSSLGPSNSSSRYHHARRLPTHSRRRLHPRQGRLIQPVHVCRDFCQRHRDFLRGTRARDLHPYAG
ncbi:MAG: hypothetical protein ACYTX0_48515, partial [Nostoc sp.]